MFQTMLCTLDGHIKNNVSHAEIRPLIADDQNVLWLDMEKPAPEDLRELGAEFGFHPLALEDATRRRQRPKIDRYGDSYFIVFYDIDYIEETDQIEERELDVFLGRNYMVTVHDRPIEEIAQVAERYHHNLGQIEQGVGVLLYSLLDTIVDHYFSVVDRVGEQVEEMETQVFSNADQDCLQGIFALRKELVDLRRAISPERDVVSSLARRDLPVIGEATGVYFQDVYDHVIRVTDTIDSYRELLTGVLDAYLTMSSNRQTEASNSLNQTVRTLTSFSIILMTVTLIAGIYGMNFNPDASRWNMPELNSRYGYPATLLAMLLIGVGLVAFFKRKGWL